MPHAAWGQTHDRPQGFVAFGDEPLIRRILDPGEALALLERAPARRPLPGDGGARRARRRPARVLRRPSLTFPGIARSAAMRHCPDDGPGPDHRGTHRRALRSHRQGRRPCRRDLRGGLVLEYVNSGERIRGKANIIASRQAYPGRPASFEIDRSGGTSDLQVVELTMHIEGDKPHPVVAVLDFEARAVRPRAHLHRRAVGARVVPVAVGRARHLIRHSARTEPVTSARDDPVARWIVEPTGG